MPLILSESLPSPTVKSYVLFSSVLFGASLLYGKSILEERGDEGLSNIEILQSDSFCLWSFVNMAYCCLFSFGKLLEHVIFGRLTPQEQQHLHDKFWNYVFYKIIFVFGVVNAQTFDEVMCWTAWFSMLGFWHIFGQLSKDRYETLTSSPTTPRKDHIKLFSLLVFITLSGVMLIIAVAYFGMADGWNTLGFIVAECILLSLKSLQIIIKYAIQLQDISMRLWEKKSVTYYYLDLGVELGVHLIDMVHHVHMLIWSNVFLSMASLVLYWNIQTIFNDFKKRWKKHKDFEIIVKNVQNRFDWATEKDLTDYKDSCAICWEDIFFGRKLPCGHIYHHDCLCSWLQQDVSCPICRRSLSAALGIPNNTPQVQPEQVDAQPLIEQQGNQGNHFFHFDGSRIASWVPSFSVEVFRSLNENNQDIEAMVHQVSAMFPSVPREDIITDLQHTHSVDLTVENILEGNILSGEEDSSALQNSDSAIEDLSEEDDEEEAEERQPTTDVLTRECSHVSDEAAEATDSRLHCAAVEEDEEAQESNSDCSRTSKATMQCRRTQDIRRRARSKDQQG